MTALAATSHMYFRDAALTARHALILAVRVLLRLGLFPGRPPRLSHRHLLLAAGSIEPRWVALVPEAERKQSVKKAQTISKGTTLMSELVIE